jgi:hypothetical protein
MNEFYKSDLTTFAQRGFIWAGEVSFRIALPDANWSGTIYQGHIPLSELDGKTAIPLQSMLAISSKSTDLKGSMNHSFTLKSAIINHQLAMSDRISSTTLATSKIPDEYK